MVANSSFSIESVTPRRLNELFKTNNHSSKRSPGLLANMGVFASNFTVLDRYSCFSTTVTVSAKIAGGMGLGSGSNSKLLKLPSFKATSYLSFFKSVFNLSKSDISFAISV